MSQTKNIKPETILIETMETPVFVKFTLLENALDSIEQGLTSFYLAENKNSNRHYKRCLLDLFQGAELLLKATLSRIDELLIFDNKSLSKCIDPAKPTKQELYSCFTVNIKTLTNLVAKKYPNFFPENGLSLINTLAIERNKIQHFAIEICPKQLAKMLRELYLGVYKPAFQLIQIDESELDSFNSKLKQKIIHFETQFLNIQIEDEYTLALCPSCESWSHFIIYHGESYPVESYCVCCDFKLTNIESYDLQICPECASPSVIYIPEHQAGACLWHKCYYSKEGGFVPMKPCHCGEYIIEDRCENCDIEDD